MKWNANNHPNRSLLGLGTNLDSNIGHSSCVPCGNTSKAPHAVPGMRIKENVSRNPALVEILHKSCSLSSGKHASFTMSFQLPVPACLTHREPCHQGCPNTSCSVPQEQSCRHRTPGWGSKPPLLPHLDWGGKVFVSPSLHCPKSEPSGRVALSS